MSAFGSQLTYLALPWFVLVTTGSAARMGVVLAVQMLPIALFGIPSGTVVGRLGARLTMIVGDAARAPLMLAIPILHSAGVLSFPLLLVCVFLLGSFFAPYFAAQRVILPELVGDDERTVAQANAILEGAQRAMSLLGPATAGFLIALIGATNVLYLDAATFVFAAIVLATLVPKRPPIELGDEGKGVLAGFRFLVRDPFMRPLGVTALFLNGFGQMLGASLPVLAYQEYGGNPRVAGAFFAAFGAGSIIGSVAAVKLVTRFDPIRLATVSFFALTLPIWALAFDIPAWAIVAALFASAIFGPLINAPLIGAITTRTPTALRAKVMTSVMTVALLAGPLALLIVGPLLASIGPRGVFAVVASGQLAAVAYFAFAVTWRGRVRAAAPVPDSG